MRIQCPSCLTTYQVSEEAVGSTGRLVRCAKCRESWHATPIDEPVSEPSPAAATKAAPDSASDAGNKAKAPAPAAAPAAPEAEVSAETPQADEIHNFDADTEDAAQASEAEEPEAPDDDRAEKKLLQELERDAAAEEADAEAADEAETESEAPADRSVTNAQLAELREAQKRVGIAPSDNLSAPVRPTRKAGKQGKFAGRLPMFAAAAAALAMVVAPILFRDSIVRAVPDMAGVYAAVGMPVNLRGLDFGSVETFREIEDGTEILVVEGMLINVDGRTRIVPAVRLSLLGEDSNELYAWAVEPRMLNLEPGETTRFRARLASPPAAATDVALRFVDRTQRQAGL